MYGGYRGLSELTSNIMHSDKKIWVIREDQMEEEQGNDLETGLT